MSEQDVDEGDDLQRFAQAHAVGEDTAESSAAAEPLHRLHQVVVQETDSADLWRRQKGKGTRIEPRDNEERNGGKRRKGRWLQKRKLEGDFIAWYHKMVVMIPGEV